MKLMKMTPSLACAVTTCLASAAHGDTYTIAGHNGVTADGLAQYYADLPYVNAVFNHSAPTDIRSVAQFDLSVVPATDTIVSVAFHWTERSVWGAFLLTTQFSRYAYVETDPAYLMSNQDDLGAWNDIGDYGEQPAYAYVDHVLGDDAGGSFTMNATAIADVQAALTGTGFFAVGMVLDPVHDNGFYAGVQLDAPSITIETVPVPTPGSVAILGIAGLMSLRRRRS